MFRHASGKRVLIADVDDGSVGVAIADVSRVPAQVIAVRRATLPIEERTKDQALAMIGKLFGETADALLKDYAKDPKAVPIEGAHVILRIPWTHFRTARKDEASEKPQQVTKEIIADLAKKALAEGATDRANTLEAGVVQVFLNGYPTGSPLNKRALQIGVVAFESTIDPSMRQSLTEALGKLLPGRTPVFHSGGRALLSVMREYIPDIHRFVILEVGGSTSACLVVRKEALTQYAEAPEGTSTILKRVASGGLPEETLTLLRMLAGDACTTNACEKLKESLARAEPELVRSFGEMFGTLANRRRLPNAAVLFAPVELAPWLQGFFSRIDFSQFTATTQPLSVDTVTPEHLLDMVTWQTNAMPDTGIGLASACVHLLEQST